MFEKKTVFILGAGASWHYGYPTGEDLVEKVILLAFKLERYCRDRGASNAVLQVPQYVGTFIDSPKSYANHAKAWLRVADQCKLLTDRLRTVQPIVIDHFLAWNDSLQPIGRLLISGVIQECELYWRENRYNPNVPQSSVNCNDWLRFVMHRMVYGSKQSNDLLKNNVHFITFNYDRSLESELSSKLRALDIVEEKDINGFLNRDRIFHMYGSINSSTVDDTDVAKSLQAAQFSFGQNSVDFH